MPAQRCGASLTRSRSQRLWARKPAQRCSKLRVYRGASSAVDAGGANGGSVLGNMTSATTPSAVCSRSRRSIDQLRSPSATGSPSTPTLRGLLRPSYAAAEAAWARSTPSAHSSKSA